MDLKIYEKLRYETIKFEHSHYFKNIKRLESWTDGQHQHIKLDLTVKIK